ncbi:12644_t:CDS:2 [Entrophospora sp. SA101]|nr:12644_t:CDS:2 [Entrophospora sp. SA101]
MGVVWIILLRPDTVNFDYVKHKTSDTIRQNPYFYNAIHTNNNNERDYAFHVREDLEVTAKIKKIETDGVLLELHATFQSGITTIIVTIVFFLLTLSYFTPSTPFAQETASKQHYSVITRTTEFVIEKTQQDEENDYPTITVSAADTATTTELMPPPSPSVAARLKTLIRENY